MGRASRMKAGRARPVDRCKDAAAGRPGGGAWTPVALLLLAIVGICIYSNTFAVPFQFDDESNIINNAFIRDWANFFDLSGTRYLGYLTFAVNYHFGGLHVVGYHLVNLGIHCTNGFLVYWLVLLLFQANGEERAGGTTGRWIALATAALFLVHPIQTQAVTYIVQRFASLVTLFYLLAVASYLQWRLGARVRWYLGALGATLIAMKTKENSFTIPFMLLLLEIGFFRPLTKRRCLQLLPFVLMLFIIPLSNPALLAGGQGFARDTMEIGRLEYLFTQFRVIVTYLRLLILPIGQNLDYGYSTYRSLFHPAVFLSGLFLLFLAGCAALALFRPRFRLVGFGLGWFFLTLSIESSVIPIKDVIFEHRLYLPSVGFLLAMTSLAAAGWERWHRLRGPLGLAACCTAGALSIATYQRNHVWRDKIVLWQDVVAKAPHNPRGHYNLGLAYEGEGRLPEAITAYRTTMTLKPDFTDAHNNLGNVYKAQGRIDEAVAAYQQALSVQPDHAEAHNNLGNIYTVQGRLDEAIRLYEKALELKPTYAEACNNLGIAYTTQGRLDEAIAVYRKGLSLQADLDKTHYNLGNAYVKKGMWDPAIQEYRAAAKLKPELPEYHFALGNAYTETGQPGAAIPAYEATTRLKPDLAEAHFALGNVYAAQRRLKEASMAYEQAVRLKPDFAAAHNNLGNIHTLEGRLIDAVRAYRRALDLQPDYTEARNNLGNVTKQLGRNSSMP